jgi:hypothetical protein
MTRLLFPHERTQLGVARQAGRPVVSLAGQWRTLYTDSDLTTLADILDSDLIPIPSSRVQIDNLSRLPEFWGPDGVGVVYDDSGNSFYPVGQVGPQGPPGSVEVSGVLSKTINVASPVQGSTVITHDLGFKPAGFQFRDGAGRAVLIAVTAASSSTLTIEPDVPFSGTIDIS